MPNNKFRYSTYSRFTFIAGSALLLLTVANAMAQPNSLTDSASGKLGAMCGAAYDKAVYKELHSVLETQAIGLMKLGMANTKTDVCAQVLNVVNAKLDPKIDYTQYAKTAYYSQAVVGAAVLYRISAMGATLDKKSLTTAGAALEVPTKMVANWKAGTTGQNALKKEGKAFISNALAQANKSDIDSTALKDSYFSAYIQSLDLTN